MIYLGIPRQCFQPIENRCLPFKPRSMQIDAHEVAALSTTFIISVRISCLRCSGFPQSIFF